MDHQRQALRAGAAAIAIAILLRLAGGGFFAPILRALDDPNVYSFLIYLQTGRVVRYVPAPGPAAPTAPRPTRPAPSPAPPAAEKPVFDDVTDMAFLYGCGYRPDWKALLTSPLDWDLTGDEPTVLILHTHATESYTPAPGDTYRENGAFHTLDDGYNMVSVGDELARVLTEGGISVVHDRTWHDYPSYNGSYTAARETIASYLLRYPSIRMVLDIHRDALGDDPENQRPTVGTVGGQPSAQIMMVVGTDANGNYHPHWQENLSLALKLTALLERADPGVTRPVNLRGERFNMDMTPGSLLIEIGAAGNTREEALLAANALARAILALAGGTG